MQSHDPLMTLVLEDPARDHRPPVAVEDPVASDATLLAEEDFFF